MTRFNIRTIAAHKTYVNTDRGIFAHIYIIYHDNYGYIEIATNNNDDHKIRTIRLEKYFFNIPDENKLLNEWYKAYCKMIGHAIF